MTEFERESNDNATRAASAREDLRDQVWMVGEDVKEFGQLTKAMTHDLLEDGRRKSVDYYERGRGGAQSLAARCDGYVRDHPWRSMLYATGAGLLLGALLRRR